MNIPYFSMLEIKGSCFSESRGTEKAASQAVWKRTCWISRPKGRLQSFLKWYPQTSSSNSVYWRVCDSWQRAEDEAQALEVAKQRELEAEKQRLAEQQQRQHELEHFSAFEEMIRRQKLEKERQRVVQEFSVPASPSSPRDLLVPDVQGPPQASFSLPTSPGGTPNHVSQTSPLPAFDRSLKPSVPVSAGHSEAQFALPCSFLTYKHYNCPVVKLRLYVFS